MLHITKEQSDWIFRNSDPLGEPQRERSEIPIDNAPLDLRRAAFYDFSGEEFGDAALSLIDFLADCDGPIPDADSVAQQLFTYGELEFGFEAFRTLRMLNGVYETEAEAETYFRTFDRLATPDDVPLVDVMSEAERSGWRPPRKVLKVLGWIRGEAFRAFHLEKSRRRIEEENRAEIAELVRQGYRLGPRGYARAEETIVSDAVLPLSFFDECRELVQKKWLIKNVIAAGENSTWYGAPGCGKSALLTDVAVSGAAGRDWRGKKVKAQCGVIYFAFERADLERRRLAAYAARDGLADLPIAVCGTLIDLLSPTCVDIVVATVRAAEARFGVPVGLIVFDTWSKGIAAGGGDENNAKEQNLVAANLRRIHGHLDVHIAGVGHSGKDTSKGERGSNARLGDVDLAVEISGDAVKTATVVKANDQPEGPLTAFAIETTALGADEDGEPVTVGIVAAHSVVATPRAAALSNRQERALAALRLVAENGQVAADKWREELFSAGVLDREAANPRADFRRLKDGLIERRRIWERDGIIHVGFPMPFQV